MCCCWRCLSPGLADQSADEAVSKGHTSKNHHDDVGGGMRQIEKRTIVIFHAILVKGQNLWGRRWLANSEHASDTEKQPGSVPSAGVQPCVTS